MKTLLAAFALVSLVATSAFAKTESLVPPRAGVLANFKADRTAARQPAQQHYALMLGVAF
jgi:hypothetical protein